MNSGKLPHTGILRLIHAYHYSINGFKACLATEEAFRLEIGMAAVMIPFALWLGDTAVEHILLIGSVLVVLIFELVNTAIERAIDRISFERHELSKEAKDMGSAAVLLSLVLCAIVWGMIILPKFF